jgi:hypothetical protein
MMKKVMMLCVIVLLSGLFLQADVYIKQQVKMGAFMGQPGKDSTAETWMGDNRMATDSPEGGMIALLGQKKIYMINHANRSYVETDLPLDMTKIMPEQMAQMMKGMMDQMSISLTPNGQTRKVGKWDAKGYDVNITMMGQNMKMVFWASKDVPFDWKRYNSTYAQLYKAQFNMGEKFVQEFLKMDGYPVATDMEMMGMKINTEVVEITKKTPGPAVYKVPDGYTKKDRYSMQDMKRGR